MAPSQNKSFRAKLLTRCGIAGFILFLLAGACGACLFADGSKVDRCPPQNTAKSAQSGGFGAPSRLKPSWKVFQVAPAASLELSPVESLLVDNDDETACCALMVMPDIHKLPKAALREAQTQAMVCPPLRPARVSQCGKHGIEQVSRLESYFSHAKLSG